MSKGVGKTTLTALAGLPNLVVMAWTFVIAYKYPVHIIAATVAICALLLRLPERRFADLEVAP